MYFCLLVRHPCYSLQVMQLLATDIWLMDSSQLYSMPAILKCIFLVFLFFCLFGGFLVWFLFIWWGFLVWLQYTEQKEELEYWNLLFLWDLRIWVESVCLHFFGRAVIVKVAALLCRRLFLFFFLFLYKPRLCHKGTIQSHISNIKTPSYLARSKCPNQEKVVAEILVICSLKNQRSAIYVFLSKMPLWNLVEQTYLFLIV